MRRRTVTTASLLAASAGVAALVGAGPATAAPARGAVTPVASVDLTRYVGTWYQLAAVPAIYEAQCAKNVTADYSVNPDGTVAVRNSCATWVGVPSTVDGTARSDNAPRNSALTVSFFSLFGKPVYGSTSNYIVFGLQPDYRWALVGDPSRRSGFVLSRTPSLPASDVATIEARISAAGYDLCSFRLTVQDGGNQSRGPAC